MLAPAWRPQAPAQARPTGSYGVVAGSWIGSSAVALNLRGPTPPAVRILRGCSGLTGDSGPLEVLRSCVDGKDLFVLDEHSSDHAGVICASEIQHGVGN